MGTTTGDVPPSLSVSGSARDWLELGTVHKINNSCSSLVVEGNATCTRSEEIHAVLVSHQRDSSTVCSMLRSSLYVGGQASGSDKCDVIVNIPLGSKRHCCIKRIGSSYYLHALGYNP